MGRRAKSVEEIQEKRELSPVCLWLNSQIIKCPLSQAQVAEMAGVNSNIFSAWKNGRQLLTIPAIIKLCEIFGCDKQYPISLKFDELYGPEWNVSPSNGNLGYLTDYEIALVKAYRDVGGNRELDSKALSKIKAIIKTLPES